MEPVSLSQPPTSRTAHRPCTSRSRASASPASRRSSASAQPGAEQLFHAKLECFVDLGPAAEGRAHVALRGGRQRRDRRGRRSASAAFRAEDLAQHIAETRARAPGRAARRGDDRRALPGAQAGARSRGITTQEIYTLLRLGGRVRARHAPARRRRRAGHDGVPVRAGARRRRARASAWPPTASPTTRSTRILEARPRRHAQPARPGHAATSAAPRAATVEIEARDLLDDRRGLDVERDLRADEAQRRGRRRREGPPPPALRRGLRARDDRAASSSASAACDDGTFVSARQENLETIHQHNVVAERFGLLGELRREIVTGEHLRASHVDARVAGWRHRPRGGRARSARPIEASRSRPVRARHQRLAGRPFDGDDREQRRAVVDAAPDVAAGQ